MATLAEHNPELARRLGLKPEAVAQDAGYLGKLCIVTFREPANPVGTRRDPMAFLPPTYDRFGVIDREYREKVKPGETWIVQPYMAGVGAVFLVPLAQVELSSILALDARFVEQLAAELVRSRPDLLGALRELLPAQARPKPDPIEVATLKTKLERAQVALGAAHEALARLSLEVPASISKARSLVEAEIPAAPKLKESKPAPAKEPAKDLPLWLADANLFINAARWKWPQCNRVLDAAGIRFRLAVTRQVFDELHHSYRLPGDLVVIDVPAIGNQLRELADANASALGKRAGTADLSLIQALVDRKDIRGIITEDPDVRNIHPESVVRKLDGRDVECVTSAEFCEAHRKLVA